ncbi:MAG: hypothetical protein GY861_20285 [bacterium]|nr:hypothetical protein [bacterium]
MIYLNKYHIVINMGTKGYALLANYSDDNTTYEWTELSPDPSQWRSDISHFMPRALSVCEIAEERIPQMGDDDIHQFEFNDIDYKITPSIDRTDEYIILDHRNSKWRRYMYDPYNESKAEGLDYEIRWQIIEKFGEVGNQ